MLSFESNALKVDLFFANSSIQKYYICKYCCNTTYTVDIGISHALNKGRVL